MRGKSFISILVFAFFAFIGGGSFSGEDVLLFFLFLAGCVLVVSIFAIVDSNKDKERMEQKRKEDEEEERRNTNRYNEDLLMLRGEYGDPTLVIDICDKKAGWEELPYPLNSVRNDDTEDTKQSRISFLESYARRVRSVNSAIIVFEPRSRVLIMGRMYDFKDIIGVSLSDDQRIVHGQTVSSTKTSTGSMIGRAVVGDLVAGPVGSIIGGSTASKNTTVTQGDDSVAHDYTILINVNSISNPVIRINTWNDDELTNRILGLFNVIVERNKRGDLPA